MPGKSQHFVPRLYLRQFRFAETKQIIITRLDPFCFVGPGAISGQCQEDYFYGKDGKLDSVYSSSEADLARVLASVGDSHDFDEKQRMALAFLAVTLHNRTRKAAEAAKVFPRFMAVEVLNAAITRGELRPCPDGELRPEMFDFQNASGNLVKHNIPGLMELSTLHCKLLRAPDGYSFITSDNPVAVLNQFCAHLEPHRNHAGFSKSGFQLVLPISPILCLFFYDSHVYKVGNRQQTMVPLSQSDVDLINALQLQSAEHCVYCHEPALQSYIRRLHTRFSHLRVPVSSTLRVLPGRHEKEQILHTTTSSVKLPAPWGFCKYLRHPRGIPGERRNPAWTSLIGELMHDYERNPTGPDLFHRLEQLLGCNPGDITGAPVS